MDFLALELLEDRFTLGGCEVARVRASNDRNGAGTMGPLYGSLEEFEEPHEARRRLGRLREHKRVRDLARVHEVEEPERLRRGLAHDHVFLPHVE